MSRAHPVCAQAVEALWFMSIILKARYAIRLAFSAATSTAKVCLTPRKILSINRPLRVATDYRKCLSQRQHERAKRPSTTAPAMMSVAFRDGHRKTIASTQTNLPPDPPCGGGVEAAKNPAVPRTFWRYSNSFRPIMNSLAARYVQWQ